MQTYLQKISAEALLAIGGSLIFSVFGLGLLIGHTDVELLRMTAFEKGEYYFNHDDNPLGPYDLQKAQYFYEEEIASDPKGNELVWYQSGRVDFINGNFDAALEKFNKQIEYFGDSVPNVYYMIGLTYGYKARITGDETDWQKAEEAFENFITIIPEAPWSRVDLAWIHFSQGEYEEMRPILEEGLRYESNNPWLLNMYGLLLLNTGDTKMAYEYFAFAQDLAEELTVEQWGKSYPGNDPASWEQGLSEFKNTLAKNVALTLE